MTFRELEARLREAGVDGAGAEAEILAERFCGVSRVRLLYDKDVKLCSPTLEDALARRLSGEPLQYIIGTWDFMNETYEVTPDVLIPRQDTEILVEWAAENIPKEGRFADLCTGSGCIAVSTLAARRDLTCVALEKYPEALATAERNAKRNGVSDRIEFVLSDVLCDEAADGVFDAVLSNPPYVTAEEYENLKKELYREPRHALTDGADGLTFYRRIFKVYPKRLKDGGAIALEIGADQGNAVAGIARGAGFDAEILRDYSGKDRVAVCRKK